MDDCGSRGIVALDGQADNSEVSVTEGGQEKINTSNSKVECTLIQILKQLKIMNLHLALLTDNYIDKTEVS